jgi:4a-hydroxytetrahydrobiopterin dehydratase
VARDPQPEVWSSGKNMRPVDHEPVTAEAAARALKNPAWVIERTRIYRDFRCRSFAEALALVNRVGEVAERLNHHPNICIHEWSFVHLELYSHMTGGISARDIELAHAIDELTGAPSG